MSMHMNFRKLAGTAVAAATLLAVMPAGAAIAADNPIDVPTTGTETITISGTAAALQNHTFKALQIGTYTSATGDAAAHRISSVSVGTVDAVKDAATTALNQAKGSTDPAAGFSGNPVGEVADHYLGYSASEAADNSDTTSNNEPKAYYGGLRKFVTNLFDNAAFKTSVEAGIASKDVAAGATSTTIEGLVPGIYVVEDTTAQDTTAQSAQVGPKNSIPMLVSTGIHSGTDVFNVITADSTVMDLGEINLKADNPSVKKSLDASAGTNSAGVGGKLHYKLTSKVPLTTGYKRYIFSMVDTPAGADGAGSPGLALDESSVKITVGGKELTAGTDYKVTNTLYTNSEPGMSFSGEGDTKSVVFDLSPSIVTDTYKDDITVTYAMNVTDNAPAAGFSNGAHLAYSNDSNNQPKPSDPNDPNSPAVAHVTSDGAVTDGTENGTVTNTATDTGAQVKSYQRSFNLKVVNKTDESQALAGAQFQVKDNKGNALKFIKLGDGSYKLASGLSAASAPAASASPAPAAPADQSLTRDAVPATSTDTLGVSADGTLKVDGLNVATYTVAQITKSTGFSQSFLPTFTVTTSAAGDGGKDSKVTNTADTWDLVKAQDTAFDAGTAILVRNVMSVSQLPLTGGAGVILFLVLAVLLIAVAGCLYALKRRNAQGMQKSIAMSV